MKFKDIKNLKQLSGFLKIDEESLSFYLNDDKKIYDHAKPCDKKTFQDSCVEKMYISKKNKDLGSRIVYNIKDVSLKVLNKVIFFYINKEYSPLDCVHGFVKERSVATNASMHLSKKKILNLDIKNFFESISKDKVIKVFQKLGCKDAIANALASLTTLDNKLVLGFNTSPIIANLAIEGMDGEFMKLANKTNCTYSRYADDICFSSNDLLPDIDSIEKIMQENNFIINEKKTKTMNRGKNQYVTGLTIFDEDYPRISKRMKKKIRLLLHYYKKYGIFSHIMHRNKITVDDVVNDMTLFMHIEKLVPRLFYKIKGWIDYVNSVEPILAKKYYADYEEINNDIEIKLEIMKKVKVKNDKLRAGS